MAKGDDLLQCHSEKLLLLLHVVKRAEAARVDISWSWQIYLFFFFSLKQFGFFSH